MKKPVNTGFFISHYIHINNLTFGQPPSTADEGLYGTTSHPVKATLHSFV